MKWHSTMLALQLLCSGPAIAHQDRVVTLRPDGSISEIPSELGGASLAVEGLGSGSPLISFSIGGGTGRVPTCLAQLIRTKSADEIELAASWHHDPRQMPLYLSVVFPDPGKSPDRVFNDGYNFMFSLETGELFEASRMESSWLQDGGEHRLLDITAACD